MHRYLNVPVAGTYDVYVYVINAAGGGTNPLCEHAWKGAPYPNYASVTTSSPYTVTYNANGGSGAPAATTKGYGINLTLSSTQPTRSGYLFTGWNTAADGSGTTYNSGAAYTGNANLTLYAQWAQSGNNSVEMASGTHDASHWSFSSNTANFGNTITVNYSGYLNLQSVTLRRKTTNTYELNSSNISTAVSNFNSQSGSRLVFTANISEQQTFTCTEGEIDMNGHSSSKDLFIQNNVLGKTITIKNGTVTGTDGAGGFNDYYNGTVVLENMTVTGRVWTDGHPYVINGGTYAEIINDINANTPGTVTIYDGKFSQLGNWGSGGTFTLYGGKYAINPSSLAYCTIPSGYSVQSNTDSDSGTYPWVVRNTSSPVVNPYSLAVTEVTANRQWTFTMPPYDVEVVVNYALSYLAYNTATGGFDAHPVPNNITAVTSGTTTMNSGWYIVNSNVTISTRITVNGTVNLILADGYSLTASQGITVNSGNTLNIYGQSGGTGTLNATGAKLSSNDGTEAAGIGSTGYSAVGNITIHGGRITATGADWSAGIGGGVRGGGGSVTIYGGTTLATAGEPTYGDQDAIGSGASGANGTKALAGGLRVTTYNNTTPVAYGNRVSNLQEKKVTVEPCTSHNLSNNVCTYCGLTIYSVTYNGNNATSGTVPAPSTEYQPGQTVILLGNTGSLARTGYTFDGWNTAANGSGTDYTAGATFAISGNTTLYAKWTPITYTVRFNKNHNDATGTMSDQAFTYDTTQTLSTNAFTHEGYDFLGWSTTTDGAVAYSDEQSVSNLATEQGTVVNLYAKWNYSITYDLAGGTVATPNPTTYTALSDDITLNNPTREGYTFVGWTGTGLTEPTMTVTIPKGSTGDRSYTANWGKGVDYIAYNTTTQMFETRSEVVNTNTVTSETTTMENGWYAVQSDVTINSRITVSGMVNLILCDGTTLTASKGITVNSGNTLNIYGQTSGTGTLNATGGQVNGSGTESAAIGSTNNSTVGNITIHGGRITANSAGWTAGIGGGIRGGGGSITIYGGTINATGHGSTSEGIGHGADGANVTKNLAEGLCVIVNNYSIPVAYGDRVSSLSQLVVRVEPCTEHNLSNNVCTYCGLSSYGVTYNSNNATSGTVPANAYYVSGQTVTVPGNTGNLERMGYTFGGWNTKANGSGTTYAEGETFAITGTLTLYAKWVASQLELANNADNGDAVSLASGDGMYYDVTLAGRTLYTDGDWNTLCLPFALASFAGTPLEGATVKTLTSSNFEDGTLTMTFSDNQTSIEAGKPYIVKYDADLFIRTAADWNNFATNVNNGTESYQGKVVKLAADISVSTMVGEDCNEFKGTFDGCGHTLTFNYTTDADNAAPFQWIKNAVIRNLTVMGEITSSKMFAAGFVARAHGDNAIESSVSSVTIHASKNGDGTHGGFVGRIESDCQTFTFTDCKFNGTFDGSNTDNWCPFAAWSMGNSNTNFIFNNCLYAPASTNVRGGCATFYRNGTPTLNGAYYTQAIGTAQGTNASGMSNETLASNLGDGWEISGGNVVPKMMNTANDIVNPVFKDVTISDATANVSTAYVDFLGTYSTKVIYEEGTEKHNLYLGSGNNLYYPSREGYSLKACRAYFQLKGITAGDPTSPTSARAFVLNFGDDEEQTGIRTITIDDRTSSPNRTGIYTLDGRKVGTASDASDSEKLKALQPGMYIVNGKKTFIK